MGGARARKKNKRKRGGASSARAMGQARPGVAGPGLVFFSAFHGPRLKIVSGHEKAPCTGGAAALTGCRQRGNSFFCKKLPIRAECPLGFFFFFSAPAQVV